MNYRLILFFVQLYVHILFLYGLLKFNIGFVFSTLIIAHIIFSGLCGTVFFHRVVTHKNKIKSVFESVLLVLSTIGLSGSALAWAATHRMHHRYSDTEKDPHSPQRIGFLRTYFYSSASANSIRYVVDLVKDKRYVFQHEYYFQLNLAYHMLILVLLPFQFYWMICIVPAFVMWFTGSIINCLSHNKNGPKNSNLLGLLFAGEGWHLNHHQHASSPNFNSKYDWGFSLYKLIK